jgi:cyclopropane fatty-acyl-phospholipid synthase-like methyltransferase
MDRFDTEQIRRYYDRNTPSFVALGQGGSVGAIHRAVWGPGTTTRDQAFHFVENRIADVVRLVAARTAEPTHVVDLGCGVGASLCYLARLLPITGTGVTLSPIQVRAARERIESARLSDRVACIEGDFGNLPNGMQTADVAYAIESFVHALDPARFFAEAARLVRPGGALVICDDVRRRGSSREAERAIHHFKRGWHVNSLLEAGELRSLASEAGFEHESTQDLSSYLELRRARDRVIDAAVAIFGWLPLEETRFGHLIGGSALQKSLASGWIGYDLMVFTRRTERHGL